MFTCVYTYVTNHWQDQENFQYPRRLPCISSQSIAIMTSHLSKIPIILTCILINVCCFVSVFFCVRFTHIVVWLGPHSFSLLHSTGVMGSLCKYTTIYLPISLWMDIWVAFSLVLFGISFHEQSCACLWADRCTLIPVGYMSSWATERLYVWLQLLFSC